MKSFVTTDKKGQFILDGKPWFLHGATYFGRRPGTCGANWLGKNFAHNAKFLVEDVRRMRDMDINTVGLFLPAAEFFNPDTLAPQRDMFQQLDRILDIIGEAGIRTVVFPETGSYSRLKAVWCRVHKIDPGTTMWCPALHSEAEKCKIYALSAFARHCADRPDVLGYMTRVGRFDFPGWDPPEALAYPVQKEWGQWLQRRFKGDLKLARERMGMLRDETCWEAIRMPPMTPANFSRANPRSYEYALMHQVLITEANDRLYRAIKKVAPRQLTINDMEGNEIPMGNCNVLIPETCTADAVWLECYNWEGMRGSQRTGERHQIWFPEPNANKRNIDVVGNAGYVQFLVRWMQQSGKPLILCHGTDVGAQCGVDTDEEQALMVDRFNSFIRTCGAHGINYWCWTDDDLSRSALVPPDQCADAEEARKLYWQAGETTGLLRHNGTERPLAGVARATGRSIKDQPAAASPHEALVLFPTPIFQSLFRYRANCTGFGIFTSLARQGILADAAFTSAGEKLITRKRLTPYDLIILGMPSYHRDHPEIPGLLLQYVKQGGTLLLPLALPNRIDDPYLNPCDSSALAALAGAAKFIGRKECHKLDKITSRHPAFVTAQTPSWEMATEAFFSKVTPMKKAEILVEADGHPLLYRHRVGQGTVYVFTWTLDVHLFNGSTYDYAGGNWDWLWQGLAQELKLTQDIFNPMTRAIREMTYRT